MSTAVTIINFHFLFLSLTHTDLRVLFLVSYHRQLSGTCNGLKTIRYVYLHDAHKLKTGRTIRYSPRQMTIYEYEQLFLWRDEKNF